MDFVLPEEITIKSVRELKDCLCELLSAPNENALSIDASHLQRIDSLGYQLLLAFQHTMTESEKTVDWSAPSEALLECNRLLGNGQNLFSQQPTNSDE
ncbi:MAG: STAS domain-containing protein [Pseudomonadales bacterium]